MSTIWNGEVGNIMDFTKESYEYNVVVLGKPMADQLKLINEGMAAVSIPKLMVDSVDHKEGTITLIPYPNDAPEYRPEDIDPEIRALADRLFGYLANPFKE